MKELETFIKANRHFPEIPSANEMETNGLALGEMNELLLKKTKKLTLHLIEKDKIITAKQKINSRQQDRLELIEKKLKTLGIDK